MAALGQGADFGSHNPKTFPMLAGFGGFDCGIKRQ